MGDNHTPNCRWERLTKADCVYRDTHHYCPHQEHACDCGQPDCAIPPVPENEIMHRRYGALSSSVNPEQLSLTVTSLGRLVVTALVTLGYVSTVQADTILTQIPLLLAALLAAWDTIQTIWGIIRKVIVAFADQGPQE